MAPGSAECHPSAKVLLPYVLVRAKNDLRVLQDTHTQTQIPQEGGRSPSNPEPLRSPEQAWTAARAHGYRGFSRCGGVGDNI